MSVSLIKQVSFGLYVFISDICYNYTDDVDQ